MASNSGKRTILAFNGEDVLADLKEIPHVKSKINELIKYALEAARRFEEREFEHGFKAMGRCGLCLVTLDLTYHAVVDRNGIKSFALKAADACDCRPGKRQNYDLHYIPRAGGF